MNVRRSLLGLTFCTCYLASHLTNKYVLSVLKFTYPTLFQGSDVLTWLPASVLFVGIIYAGSKALSRLAVPVFFILHNVAEVLTCGYQKCVWKEKTSISKICSALFLSAAAGCLPFQDSQFDPDGYFWALIHFFCVGSYKILRKSRKPTVLRDIDQQYLNYIFSMVLLVFASHPTGDLFGALDFPFLYFYRFHGSCCASGVFGFFLMLSTVKLRSILTPEQCAAWIFLAKLPAWWTWRGPAGFLGAEEFLMKRDKGRQHAACYWRTQQLASLVRARERPHYRDTKLRSPAGQSWSCACPNQAAHISG
ncbi:transmembrane protein 241 isoform X2 [Apodemus sylvaticus]|uniref:transmembrane protein 241 isoform X2 n=1 Tax=Apodemus sylvaticus TaxID=10129 RepID=UPI002244C396|nr:transmembrane protein 241 isoform X2 [Apodemus sylvaticus]